MNDYYVYIYYRLDTNEPFYVGKGRDRRWKDLRKRCKHFNNIINKYPIAVEIVKDNLTNEQASDIECWIINELVFEYGFSIDILDNRSNEKGCHLVNCTWGGEGTSGWKHSEETKNKISKSHLGKHFSDEVKNKMSESRKGENHPMYGKHHTEESKKKMSKGHIGINPLKNKTEEERKEIIKKQQEGRGMINPFKNKTKEEMDEIKRKMSESSKGELNPNFGKHLSNETKKKISEANKGKKHSKETKRKISENMSGKNHPGAKSVICITTKRIFLTVREGAKYYNIKSPCNITFCCNKNYKSAGKLPNGTKLVWRYLVWNHNKKFRIK